jgi:hypothetical protein
VSHDRVQRTQYSHLLAYVKHVGRAASLSRVKAKVRQPEKATWRGRVQLGKSGTDDYRDKSESASRERACDTCESARAPEATWIRCLPCFVDWALIWIFTSFDFTCVFVLCISSCLSSHCIAPRETHLKSCNLSPYQSLSSLSLSLEDSLPNATPRQACWTWTTYPATPRCLPILLEMIHLGQAF